MLLTDPVTFPCGQQTKNRVALAALTNQQSPDDGLLSDDEERWLRRRAEGGFGIVTTCAAFVTPSAKGFDGQLGVATAAHTERLRPLARAIQASGALGLVQLYHGGVRSPSRLTGAQPVSASAFSLDEDGFEAPRALDLAELPALEDAFVDAARRVVDAGFAGVELHAAHGYLLSQFLSRTMNTRDDDYGGSLDRRYHLLQRILTKTRAALPRAIVGVRLSPEDYGYAKGIDLDDSLEVARRLGEDGADFVHVSLWDAKRLTKQRPTQHPIPLFRRALRADVPLFVAGAIGDRSSAETALTLGADVVAIGRAAIVNPDFGGRVADPSWSPTLPPLTPAEYEARAVSPAFVRYLRRFKNMVAD
jgi:2,4-dienoyl-CoA reductase-like NADH-dependent reductase (Old Yellow Enzyme family)